MKIAVLDDYQNVARDMADWETVLNEWYSEDLPGQHPDGRMHKAQGSGNSQAANS